MNDKYQLQDDHYFGGWQEYETSDDFADLLATARKYLGSQGYNWRIVRKGGDILAIFLVQTTKK